MLLLASVKLNPSKKFSD